MKVCFVYSDAPRERLLAEAVIEGARKHGDQAWMVPKVAEPEEILKEDADVYCVAGVKARRLYEAIHRRSAHTVMFDKGYSRHIAPGGGPRCWEYWRVAVDAQHPTNYLMLPPLHLREANGRLPHRYPADRMSARGWQAQRWRAEGNQIVIAGSSQKYHDFYGIGDPTQYWEKQITKLRKFTKRTIVYRPKPSWKEAVPIDGTDFYHGEGTSIDIALKGAYILVTHGSNACFDAVLAGIPCVILGEGIAKPISTQEITQATMPRLASREELERWLCALAYAQWTKQEMASGEMWTVIRPRLLS